MTSVSHLEFLVGKPSAEAMLFSDRAFRRFDVSVYLDAPWRLG